ncbi:MAG TPA: NADH:ubiquinone oxidoreductase subunit N, partial [Burkholderiaceae bacterium]|nr:NADH:ubiquinone oxidoreductase subunit N [Burkholderiaceae bacterium]
MDKLNLLAALPEIVLLVAASVVLLADVIKGRGQPVDGIDRLALIALLAPLFATIAQIGTPVQYAFNGMYVSDELARLLKVCAYVATAVTLLYARVYIAQRQMYR